MKDIEFINPIYETDDIDDPNLKKYSDKFDLEFWSATYGGLNFEREKMYFKSIFDESYKNHTYILPYFWMPKYSNATDPSARTLDIYNSTF